MLFVRGAADQVLEDEGPQDERRGCEQEEPGGWHFGSLFLTPPGGAGTGEVGRAIRWGLTV